MLIRTPQGNHKEPVARSEGATGGMHDIHGDDQRPAAGSAASGQEISRRRDARDEGGGEAGGRLNSRRLSRPTGSEGFLWHRYLVLPRGDSEVRGLAPNPRVFRKTLRQRA